MTSEQDRIERLQAEIALKRTALTEYKAALLRLQKEVEVFARQYDQVIGPLETQLDAIRQQIEALQTSRSYSDSIWGAGYKSFEESFDAKYRREVSYPAPLRQIPDETSLRSLYRKLARQYHPDTTTNPAEKARLTVIMAQINAAYRAKKIDALYALDSSRMMPTAIPLAPRVMGYQELYNLSRQLDDEIDAVKIEHRNLLDGPFMALKIECSLARARGINLLQEIAVKARAELNLARAELDALRRQR